MANEFFGHAYGSVKNSIPGGSVGGLTGLAFLAPLAILWRQVWGFCQRFYALFVATLVFQDDQTKDAVTVFLRMEWRQVGKVKRFFTGIIVSPKGIRDQAVAMVEAPDGPTWYRRGRQVVRWDPTAGVLLIPRWRGSQAVILNEVASMVRGWYENDETKKRFQKRIWVGRARVDGSSKESVAAAPLPSGSEGRDARHSFSLPGKTWSYFVQAWEIYDVFGFSREELMADANVPPLVRHYTDPEMLEWIEQLEAWTKCRNWMRDRGLPHRYGVLLHGPPGTGKSSLVEAVAEYLGLPLTRVILSTCCDKDMERLAQDVRGGVMLIEDIDTIFRGRENISAGGEMTDKLNFDALLNLLSGVSAAECLTFITTNDYDSLDEALIRPGRIERQVAVPLLREDGRKALAQMILGDCGDELVREVLSTYPEDLPAAHFSSACQTMALTWCHANMEQVINRRPSYASKEEAEA